MFIGQSFQTSANRKPKRKNQPRMNADEHGWKTQLFPLYNPWSSAFIRGFILLGWFCLGSVIEDRPHFVGWEFVAPAEEGELYQERDCHDIRAEAVEELDRRAGRPTGCQQIVNQ